MSFELKSDETVGHNIKRIVHKQLDYALEQLTPAHEGRRDEAVHEARKVCKRIRAVLRLVRAVMGDKVYRHENTWLRDAARPLTKVRDARVCVETLDGLTKHFEEHIAGRSFDDIRNILQADLRAIRKQVLDDQNAFAVVSDALRQAHTRAKEWTNVPDKWSSIGNGLGQTYDKAQLAFTAATDDPTVENLHECRKQTKYLRYQLEILQPLWPERMKELASETDKLGELLGDEHDLAVLRQLLMDDPKRFSEESERELLLALIDRRRVDLTREAFLLGERFYEDRTDEFARRLRNYCKTWRAYAKSAQYQPEALSA